MTTTKNTTAIENFLSGLRTEIDILNLINLEDISFSDAYNSIYDMIDENNGFDMEVIYYASAMEYLMQNDNSLRESLEIAEEYGFELTSLSSEILASLLKSRNVREEFNELQGEIDNFFTDLLEQEEEENED